MRDAGCRSVDRNPRWRQEWRPVWPRSLWVTPDVLDRDTSAWVEGLGLPSAVWSCIAAGARPLHRRMLPADGVVIREPFVLTEISVAGSR